MIDQAGLLKIVAEGWCRYPSNFAYRALELGFIKNNTGRRWKRQGAGRIGASVLKRLEAAKLVRWCGGKSGHELTSLGLAAIREVVFSPIADRVVK